VDAVAAELGVLDVLNKYPSQMSGGQKQRVAAARAIVSDPELILADEPTGALDSKSSRALLDALTMMNTQLGATIMMVTHDAFAASFASRVVFLRDGRIFNEVLRGTDSREDLFARIMDVVTYLAQAE
jgi:putative ABC transport system ATP-binding protein